jgi:hypothetical protein
MMGKLIQQVIRTSTLAMDLRATVTVNRAAICRLVLRPILAFTSHGGAADSERERECAAPVFSLLEPGYSAVCILYGSSQPLKSYGIPWP